MERTVEKKEYLIGDMSRMVGLSRDALRFYEKKGVIRTRKRENGYRYFSEDDIYRLMCVLYHRKMNDSLEDIEEFVNGKKTVEYMQEHISQRITQEEEVLLKHQQAITRLKLTSRDIDSIRDSQGSCSVKKFPAAYILGSCANLQEGLLQWFELSAEVGGLDMTYFYNILTCEDDRLVNGKTQLLFYKSLKGAVDRDINLDAYPSTEEFDCIYMVAACEEALPGRALMEQMADWGKARGLETEQTLYSNNMTSFLGAEKTTYYMELYMPLRRA